MTEQNEDLEPMLAQWREVQREVASQVVEIEDPPIDVSNILRRGNSTYKHVPANEECANELYGGVDVSFPKNDEEPSVAVYVIMRGNEIVYQDHEYFNLQVPYVSSYLSFREIEPLERLVKKQMERRPDLTPRAILVDGNGIIHARKAGIACFLGVRTGIKTIGVGKKMYNQDGLTNTQVAHEVKRSMCNFLGKGENDDSISQSTGGNGLVIAEDYTDVIGHDSGDIESLDMGELMTDFASCANGFALKLKGESGTVWGAALVGHGGRVTARKARSNATVGTKNYIIISIGHNVSLQEAIQICTEVSFARIPEPVRMADLKGRELMRAALVQS